ncbi:hypothetical protein [Seonamhaeicola sp.]|uniref:hypothetical protein n=1 Tax=Seonamhaeicola sp. TaxID=1912245 RepID=UPI0026140028|nr:hypothetical protein [Seonamhaeicola sp.]
MTIPHLGQQQFIDFLLSNGCVVVSNENWDDFDRIMLSKDGVSFPLQMQNVYYYYTINKICEDLGIEPPDDCKKMQAQIKEIKKEG